MSFHSVFSHNTNVWCGPLPTCISSLDLAAPDMHRKDSIARHSSGVCMYTVLNLNDAIVVIMVLSRALRADKDVYPKGPVTGVIKPYEDEHGFFTTRESAEGPRGMGGRVCPHLPPEVQVHHRCRSDLDFAWPTSP